MIVALEFLLDDVACVVEHLCFGGGVARQHPYEVDAEQQERRTAVDNGVVLVVGFNYPVVALVQRGKPDFTSWTVAGRLTEHGDDIVVPQFRVMHAYHAVLTRGVFGLGTLAQFEQRSRVPPLFVPDARVVADIEVFLQTRVETVPKGDAAVD